MKAILCAGQKVIYGHNLKDLFGLLITVMSFILILTVYGRFFRLYFYTALAPLPLASFAGEGTSFARR